MSVFSAVNSILSLGRAGAIVIIPAGELISPWDSSQPASRVSAKGIGTANFPATSKIENPSAKVAPLPPFLLGTQASVSPDSSKADHNAKRQSSFFAELRVCGSLKSSKILVVESISNGSTSDIDKPS